MSIKTKLGLSIGAAALGLSLIGGGTFAYFTKTVDQNHTFTSGTIDMAVDPSAYVNLPDFAPGDYVLRNFKITNTGSVDIGKISLRTSYTINDATDSKKVVPQDVQDAYAKAIMVDFLYNTGDSKDDGKNTIVLSKSLYQLKSMTPDNLAEELDYAGKIFGIPVYSLEKGLPANSGIESGNNFSVKFRFNDDGTNQNALQNLKLGLTWSFEGKHTGEDGKDRSKN